MKYQNTLTGDKIQCTVCPRNCKLKEGQAGFCKVRKNVQGNIVLETYGYNTGLSVDPIEKKPLYHFYPGSGILSFGTMGCNMGCQFCQNWNITKVNPNYELLNKSSPEEIVKIALEYNCESVAFTYNDPIVFLEYAVDTAKLCRESGIKTVAVTSGFINPEPRKEFFEYMDAVNIDLKGFSERFYRKNCLAKLGPVLDTIKYVKDETDCWLEITTLLIEGENDDVDMIERECNWIINNLGFDIPLHFSAFFPSYKFLNRKPTSVETVFKAYKIATDMGLDYVYTGNIKEDKTSTTYCKNCKKAIIRRSGYTVSSYNLEDGKCKFCSTPCDGCFD